MERTTVAGLHVTRSRPGPGTAPHDTSGPTVVLVHGTMDRASSMSRISRSLPDLDVAAYDRRGYGRSAGLGPPESIDRHVEDLSTVLDHLDGPVVLVGHSFGGLVVMAGAARRNDVVAATLTYESPSSWLPGHDIQPGSLELLAMADDSAAAETFMRRMLGDRAWGRLPPATRRARRAEGAALRADLRSLPDAGPPFDPNAVTMPAVLAYGGASGPRLARAAYDMATALPKGEVHEIASAQHPAHLTHAHEVARLVRVAVDRTTAGQPTADCGGAA